MKIWFHCVRPKISAFLVLWWFIGWNVVIVCIILQWLNHLEEYLRVPQFVFRIWCFLILSVLCPKFLLVVASVWGLVSWDYSIGWNKSLASGCLFLFKINRGMIIWGCLTFISWEVNRCRRKCFKFHRSLQIIEGNEDQEVTKKKL